jgi:hypothetical protein
VPTAILFAPGATVAAPGWVKQALDLWGEDAGTTSGQILRSHDAARIRLGRPPPRPQLDRGAPNYGHFAAETNVPLANHKMTESWELLVIRTVLDSTSRWLALCLTGASSLLKSRTAVQLENFALWHQITVLQRSAKKRPGLQRDDRLFWL